MEWICDRSFPTYTFTVFPRESYGFPKINKKTAPLHPVVSWIKTQSRTDNILWGWSGTFEFHLLESWSCLQTSWLRMQWMSARTGWSPVNNTCELTTDQIITILEFCMKITYFCLWWCAPLPSSSMLFRNVLIILRQPNHNESRAR